MKVIEFKERTIYGITTRTNNANEMNAETAMIGKAWKEFDEKVSLDYQAGDRVFGVYYNYASDMNEDFSVLAGSEKEAVMLDKVIIQGGRYLMFQGVAEKEDVNARISTVIDIWVRVWEYFANESSKYKRAYTTDFEYYKSKTEIAVCIAIES